MSQTALQAAVLAIATWWATNEARAATFSPAEARKIVDELNATEFNNFFDPRLVMAIIQVESSFRPEATRFESHLNDHSIGLMQVLFSTARDRGLRGAPTDLFNPRLNILIGMKQLEWSYRFLRRRFGREPSFSEWVGSYNAGVGNVAVKGFIPTGYVNKVTRAMREF